MWWQDSILQNKDYAGEQAGITDDMLGRGHVYFLPYLMGERSPINDTDARGTFIGMTMDTTHTEMTQAMLEGVAFAFRDCLEVAKSIGVPIPRAMLCGGGSKSPLWRKIMTNVLNIPLDLPVSEQGPGYGGAILAMVGCGIYPSVQDACEKLVSVKETIYPDPAIAERYEERYRKFSRIYPACRELFKELA
jgi:xylulokinase